MAKQETTTLGRIQLKRDLKTNWKNENPIIKPGELSGIYETVSNDGAFGEYVAFSDIDTDKNVIYYQAENAQLENGNYTLISPSTITLTNKTISNILLTLKNYSENIIVLVPEETIILEINNMTGGSGNIIITANYAIAGAHATSLKIGQPSQINDNNGFDTTGLEYSQAVVFCPCDQPFLQKRTLLLESILRLLV